MEEVIWVEILSRQRGVTARYRCEGRAVRIGRGYGNDVVLDDPHVAAEHLLVVRDGDGSLIAEDLGSATGILAEKGGAGVRRVVLDGDRPIRIGQTLLRVRDAGFAVPPERIAEPRSRAWAALVVLALLVLGLDFLSTWLSDIDEFRASRYVMPPVYLVVLVLGWAAIWAVLSRLFAGEARFTRHLLIAISGMLAFAIGKLLVEAGAFALSWRLLAEIRYMVPWIVIAPVCFFHLRTIQRSGLVLKAAIVGGLATAIIASQALSQADARFGIGELSYVRVLFPPSFRLVPLQDEKRFFGTVEAMMKKLDAARHEVP